MTMKFTPFALVWALSILLLLSGCDAKNKAIIADKNQNSSVSQTDSAANGDGSGSSSATDNSDSSNNSPTSENADSGNTDSGNTDSGNTDSGNADSGNTDPQPQDDSWRIQNPSLPSGQFIFNLKGFDASTATASKPSKIAFNFGIGYAVSSKSTEDKSLKNGKNIFATIQRGQKFRLYTFGAQADPIAIGKPQNCSIDFATDPGFKKSISGDFVVNMDCKTPVSLVAFDSTTSAIEL